MKWELPSILAHSHTNSLFQSKHLHSSPLNNNNNNDQQPTLIIMVMIMIIPHSTKPPLLIHFQNLLYSSLHSFVYSFICMFALALICRPFGFTGHTPHWPIQIIALSFSFQKFPLAFHRGPFVSILFSNFQCKLRSASSEYRRGAILNLNLILESLPILKFEAKKREV